MKPSQMLLSARKAKTLHGLRTFRGKCQKRADQAILTGWLALEQSFRSDLEEIEKLIEDMEWKQSARNR